MIADRGRALATNPISLTRHPLRRKAANTELADASILGGCRRQPTFVLLTWNPTTCSSPIQLLFNEVFKAVFK